jgi:predicted HTH transcriptional regulator
MIREGEHQGQDFKFCINDSKKIARSLVAFANTDGGRLLIGVKDNGKIAGVRSDEEYYMVEAAAKIYSKPSIHFSTRQHIAEGKTVLEISVEASSEKPHFAKDDNGRWLAYFRKNDENRLANKVMIEVWKKKAGKRGILINYSDSEKCLLDWLEKNKSVSVSRFSRLAHIPFLKAEQVIIDFIVLDILKIRFENDKIVYSLNENFDRGEWDRHAG